MEINDPVYGRVVVNEPVLVELINSYPVQRLKKIDQHGANQYINLNKTFSRYEHSVGVMILLQRIGASVEEQAAGLLHDTPHTAFSHVIDFVFGDHEFHEKFYEEVILESEIPTILEHHDLSTEKILDQNNFPLLERALPDLCADRIDYTLRDLVHGGHDRKKIDKYIDNFVNHNSEIIIKNKKVAQSFAQDYLDLDAGIWSHPLSVAVFQILADAIKVALDKKILTHEDLFQDDQFVDWKLKNSGDNLILEKLAMLNPKLKVVDNKEDFTFYSQNKLRYIDPKYIDANGKIERVANAYIDFSESIDLHKQWAKRGHYIKVLSY